MNKLPSFEQIEIVIPDAEARCAPRSLMWHGDTLIDRAGGGTFGLDGKIGRTINEFGHTVSGYGYRFNSAVSSPSGRYAVIYERRGTKGIILRDGEFLREINRSYYHSDVYDFPVLLITLPDGREVIVHCPEAYCELQIEELETGHRLTERRNKPQDFFYSRLAANPSGTRFLSAGWIWHPFDAVLLFETEVVLREPALLDNEQHWQFRDCSSSINSACFLDDDRVILYSDAEADDFHDDDLEEERARRITPGTISVFNLQTQKYESIVPVTETIGTLMPVGKTHAVGFYGHPKLIDLATGTIVHRWPDLATGKQNSSIHREELPPLAIDATHARFAVAGASGISVVTLQISA